MRTGHVDVIRRDQIAGWAADPDAPNEVLEVLVLVNGREAGRAMADRLRFDLRDLGKYGAGRHGFEFTFAPPLDPDTECEIVVRCAADDVALPRGAFRLRRRADVDAQRAAAVEFRDWLPQRNPSATSRPRYVLHVGLPKTGTKYLQSSFWHLRRELYEKGVYYPSQWWREEPIFAHHELAESLKQVPDARIADIFAQLNACGAAIVLLSSEGFNPVPERGFECLRELTQGSKIDIAFYARRWSDWIPSQWQQAVKQGSAETFPEWHAALLSTADRHPGINQALFLDKFARIFGRENIKLLSYSNLMDNKVDIFRNFCETVLHLPEPPEPRVGGGLVHESMGIFLTELIRCLNAQQPMRSARPGHHVFQAFHELQSEQTVADDVKRLFAAMERHIGELVIDDNAGFLECSYARLNAYRDALSSPEYGDSVFARRSRRCRYVRPDYLLEAGAAAAAARLAEAVRRRLERAAVPSAA